MRFVLPSTVQAVRYRGMSWSSIGKCNLLKSGGHTQLPLVGDEVKLAEPVYNLSYRTRLQQRGRTTLQSHPPRSVTDGIRIEEDRKG